MVVKFTISHLYYYPWEKVVKTHLTKYPTSKEPNVLGGEVVERRKEKDGVEYLKMVVTCVNVIPSVFRKIKALDVPTVQYEEECWIDLKKRHMSVKSRSLAFTEYATMTESSTFTAHPEKPEWTAFSQEGEIVVRGLGRMGWLVERFAKTFLTRGMKRNLTMIEELIRERY